MEYTFYAKGIGDEILADYEGQVEFDETKMPVFDADNDDFTLTLYNLNYGHNYIMNVNDMHEKQNDNFDTFEKEEMHLNMSSRTYRVILGLVAIVLVIIILALVF